MSSSRKKLASEAARLLASLGASKGGRASAAALSEEDRKRRACNAVAVRWAKVKRPGGTLPVDQAAVMSRLQTNDPVVLRIAPGAGGARRRAAISRLAQAGKLRVLSSSDDAIVVRAATADDRHDAQR